MFGDFIKRFFDTLVELHVKSKDSVYLSWKMRNILWLSPPKNLWNKSLFALHSLQLFTY